MRLLECNFMSSIGTSRPHVHLHGPSLQQDEAVAGPKGSQSPTLSLKKALIILRHTHDLESCMRRNPTARPGVRLAHAKTALHARNLGKKRELGEPGRKLEP